MTEVTQGVRRLDNSHLTSQDKGAYCREVRTELEADKVVGWSVCTPNGRIGFLDPDVHTVVEHEDGSVSVSPSLLIDDFAGRPGSGYHGFLQHGVWTTV